MAENLGERENQSTNIVLIGFMGCGKSSVGRELARMVGYEYVDTDEEIIASASGMPIPEIFDVEGEEGFRRRERGVLEGLVDSRGKIISTGGGVPVAEKNRVLLKKMGYVVWLDARVETIMRRVSTNQDRPLLQVDDPEAKVRELLSVRGPIYKEVADLRVETDDLGLNEVAYGVAESVRHFFGQET